MSRRLSIAIAPATDTTCGDGSGAFCPMMTSQRFGALFGCRLFNKELRDEHGVWSGEGWLQRLPECIEAERQYGGEK
ncbi:MAG: hypothetical protein IPG04_17230 [Polyangiaceae bacterium]|nr:hypothetical protein [Polyangiaceae bacterium]